MRGTLLALAPVLLAAATVSSVPLQAWVPHDSSAFRIEDIDKLRTLAAQYPESAVAQRLLLRAAAKAGDADLVQATLQKLEGMGYALQAQSLDQLSGALGAGEVTAAKARSGLLRKPVAKSSVFTTIDPVHRLVEGIAHDRRNGRYYFSVTVGRQLLVLDDAGIRPVPGIEAGSLSGIAVDEARRLLWTASAVFEHTPDPESAFKGLIAYDLDRQTVAKRILAPAGATLSDIGIGLDGTVYASDPISGVIYRHRVGSSALEILTPAGMITGPQGIAAHPDGHRIYVTDYGFGIAIIEPDTGKVERLVGTGPMMLDGIDGLYWYKGSLIGAQNGTSPMRIIRIFLSEDGRRATRLQVLESNHPEWFEPTLGQIDGEDFLYVSDAQGNRFGPGGKLIGEESMRPNKIRRLPLQD